MTMPIRLSAVSLLVLALVAAVGATYPYPGGAGLYRNYFPPRNINSYNAGAESRLQRMQQELRDVTARLRDAESLISDLAHQQCQTGRVNIRLCPDINEFPTDESTVCVTSPQAGLGAVVVNDLITFATPFVFPPVVEMSLTGQAVVLGKNCSVTVTAVENDGFEFTFLADDLLPVAVQLSYFACPPALLPRGVRLPLPRDQVLGHGNGV